MAYIHVVAAVIENEKGQYLIAKRAKDSHQGGLWEFPGGKIELNETAQQALSRELFEELGIQIVQVTPLIKIPWQYPDKTILLDVYRVTEFLGEAWGCEGQPLKWVEKDELLTYKFPLANKPIITACHLPENIAITAKQQQPAEIINQVKLAISKGAKAVLFRQHKLEPQLWQKTALEVQQICSTHNRLFIANTTVDTANKLSLPALHLTSSGLQAIESRNSFTGKWLSASCHSAAELEVAVNKGIDFALLSPVQPTLSHPKTNPLGWQTFKTLAAGCPLPVYALGGMKKADIANAINNGAQGIAAINAWLN